MNDTLTVTCPRCHEKIQAYRTTDGEIRVRHCKCGFLKGEYGEVKEGEANE